MPSESAAKRTVARFGLFEVDLESGQLRREGRRVAIQQHPLLVLVALLERPGQEVSRDDLRQRLWPDQQFLDFENGINTAVGRLRQALGDSAENPRFIATRRGHGYRLLAPVIWGGAPEDTGEAYRQVDTSDPASPSLWYRRRPAWVLAVAAGVFVIFSVALVMTLSRAKVSPTELAALSFTGGTTSLLVHAPAGENLTGSFALSPSGTWLAFVTGGAMPDQSHICLRSLDGVTVRSLPGTDGGSMPFWSPDGSMIGFFAHGRLKTIHVETGRIATIADAPSGRGGTWNRDGVILFAPDLSSAILSVSATGGQYSPATDVAGEVSHRFPFFLPDGRHFLYLALREDRDQSEIRWGRLGGPESGRLVDAGSNAGYVQPGYLVFARGTVLLAEAFDATTLRQTGPPLVVEERVGVYGEEGPTGLAAFSVSASGALAVADLDRPALHFSWLDRQGRELRSVGPVGDYLGFDLSPDAARAVVVRFDPRKRSSDLLVIDLRSGIQSQLTDDSWPDFQGPWAPNGGRIAFTSLRRGATRAFVRDWPRGGQEREFAQCNTIDSWFPDGRSVLCERYSPNGIVLWRLPVEPGEIPMPLVRGLKSPVTEARVSPDGRWLAYSSDENGRGRELFVVALHQRTASPAISLGPGTSPRWRGDGRELFFLSGRTLTAVAVDSSARAPFGRHAPLFETHLPPRDSLSDQSDEFAVTRDGAQFLFPSSTDNEARSAIRVVPHWTAGSPP